MKFKWLFVFLILILFWSFIHPNQSFSKEYNLPPSLLAYVGKYFRGFKDPGYSSYDLLMREFLVKRIDQKFGLRLNPNQYSGFDLLEIESLLKCKKSNEPPEIFLKMFPKGY